MCERNDWWREGVKKWDSSEPDAWENVWYCLLSGSTHHGGHLFLCGRYASIYNKLNTQNIKMIVFLSARQWYSAELTDPKTMERSAVIQMCLCCQEVHQPGSLIILRAGLYFVTVTACRRKNLTWPNHLLFCLTISESPGHGHLVLWPSIKLVVGYGHHGWRAWKRKASCFTAARKEEERGGWVGGERGKGEREWALAILFRGLHVLFPPFYLPPNHPFSYGSRDQSIR